MIIQLSDYFNWDNESILAFRQDLLTWYDEEKRDLPWRDQHNPYYTWVSEIMLQQTQVSTVIPYFERFIAELPNVEALANANEEDLMLLWQGLGYYSRVRNMKVAAQQIMEEYNGEIPSDYEALLTLKGIGPYTAGAIASMAFNKAEPALDGNLMRITVRLFNIHEDITRAPVQRLLRNILKVLIAPDRPGDFNQALMDMGATIMTANNPYPNPHPLKDYDLSYQLGTSHLLPNKKKATPSTNHMYLAFLVENENEEALLRLHGKGELLNGLWHFPLYELESIHETIEKEDLEHAMCSFMQFDNTHILKSAKLIDLPIKHIFSHRNWTVLPVKVKVSRHVTLKKDLQWIKLNDFGDYPMSTLQIKILQSLFDEDEL